MLLKQFIKSRRIGWAGHATRTSERKMLIQSVWKIEVRRSLGISVYRCEDNIKRNVKL